MASATPPLDAPIGVFFGLALFAASHTSASREGDGFRSALKRGATFGWCANVVALRFVPDVIVRFTPLPRPAGWIALGLLAASQALAWGTGAVATRYLRKLTRPPDWLAVALGVYVATFVPTVFPWTPAGLLTAWPWLLQSAELVGERGTSFLLACVASLAVASARDLARPHGEARRSGFILAAMSGALLALLAAHGHVRMRATQDARQRAKHSHIALLQPSFDAFDRWDDERASSMLERLSSLTRSAEQRGAELTIWPESSYPYTLARTARTSPDGPTAVLQPGVRGPVLTGAYLRGRPGVGYNAAVLASSDGTLSEPYEKRHLLWFGETIPLSDVFPVLRRIFARGQGLEAGTKSVTFATGAVRAAVLNCYEDTLPSAGREAIEGRPNLLVNITNDAWFVESAESELHLRLSVLRAIETRRDLVRAVNLGPTSHVDASGRILSTYSARLPGALHAHPALLETGLTPYAKFGDAPLVGTAIVITAAWRRRRGRPPKRA